MIRYSSLHIDINLHHLLRILRRSLGMMLTKSQRARSPRG
jgi:hypothetical protein